METICETIYAKLVPKDDRETLDKNDEGIMKESQEEKKYHILNFEN